MIPGLDQRPTIHSTVFVAFFSSPNKQRDGTLKYVETACFLIISNSALKTQAAVKCCINYTVDKLSLHKQRKTEINKPIY
jgi:hypothetical protein